MEVTEGISGPEVFLAADEQALEDVALNLGELDLTSEEFLLDEVDVHIQENLEDDIVKEALNKGVDLRQYSKEVERELLQVEHASIQDYVKESQNIASLHKQIAACDTILERMEQMLNGFQGDLSSISNEIQSLQEQSIAMNVKLKNRQAIRGELSQFVDEMVLPEDMVKQIQELPVTDHEFLVHLHELNHKINFVKEQAFREARSAHDVRDYLHKLKLKAISKIREFLLQKINAFRKPMTNYQIPQQTMHKFRFFNEFLIANERNVAREVRDEYIDTLSKMYYSYFKGYASRLLKLQFEEVADKDDLMAVEDTAKRGFFSSKPSLKNRSTVFTLGARDEILGKELEAPVIVPHAAQKSEARYTFESLFRSLHFALMDNCSVEFTFVADFFMVSGVAHLNLFDAVMGKTLMHLMKVMEDSIGECYDSVAIFLSIHIIYRYRKMMQTRGQPALDRYWDGLLARLWPRFEQILVMNIKSVHNCDPSRLGKISVKPHYILRRYAEFSGAMNTINESEYEKKGEFRSERVDALLEELHGEVENFILKMAAEFPQRREQLVFLINNYDIMLTILGERSVGAEGTKEAERVRDLLTGRSHEFVEEVLAPHFGGLITFVKDSEGLLDRGLLDSLKGEEKRVTAIVRGFNADWKPALETISKVVIEAFPNFKNGNQILQGALTQLIQYYHRFQKLLSQPAFRAMAVRNEVINIHHVLVEVKKYKPMF